MTTRFARRLTVIAFIISIALPVQGQQYLYTPQPATSDQSAPSQDGILVREITVHKGDSLYRISRQFSGHGMYFPQIILFNELKNPNLIHPGDTLRVPVSKHDAGNAEEQSGAAPAGSSRRQHSSRNTRKSSDAKSQSKVQQSAPVQPASSTGTDLSLNDLKTDDTGKHKTKKAPSRSGKDQLSSVRTPAESRPAQPSSATSVAGQKLFDAASKAYGNNDCRTALDLFDRYLTENAGSPLAADANLYKAECYMKMSAQ